MPIVERKSTPLEDVRIPKLLELIPKGYRTVLDVGAKDGYISQFLTPWFEKVVALDLEKPAIDVEGIIAVQGDATHLEFADNSFDVVVCAEVLEHVPGALLAKACSEIARVAKHCVVIGVPYRQDLRLGRTTCQSCGAINPPWGHVNSMDDNQLLQLFRGLVPARKELIEKNRDRTNFLSAWLMNLAGNPWGTYSQGQGCIGCGQRLIPLSKRTPFERGCSAIAYLLNKLQRPFLALEPTWIHIVFRKHSDHEPVR